METLKYVYMHDCGGPAFLYRHIPDAGTIATPADGRHLDGRPITAGSPMLCDSCGRPIAFKPIKQNLVPLTDYLDSLEPKSAQSS